MKKLSVVSMMCFSYSACRLRREEGGYGKPEGGRDACRRRCRHRAPEQHGRTQAGAERIRRPVPDPKGQPINVGDVQLGSSMSMPSMAPMSGDSEITPTGQTGTYRVKSNFAMSGAWHFTVS